MNFFTRDIPEPVGMAIAAALFAAMSILMHAIGA